MSARLERSDRLGGYAVRWGIRRYSYTVDPGLYAVGFPDGSSEVLVTANYKLSFDALRRELDGLDVWLLVLDTRGINVWCAAGKGTFGTNELCDRIESSELGSVVTHRRVVLPQLGAPGVAGHEVARRTGFSVSWGPVRASDVARYLSEGRSADAQMRRVRFPLRDRAVLVPVEALSALRLAIPAALVLLALGALGPGGLSLDRLADRSLLAWLAPLLALVAGSVLTPLALPRLTWTMFSAKGAEMGVLVSLVLLTVVSAGPGLPVSRGDLVSAIALIVAGSSYFAMNFTGSSTYTSLHGVEFEIARSVRWQAAAATLALVACAAGGWW